MEKTLLNTKWLGATCVVLVSFIFSYLACNYAVKAMNTFMPTVVTEVSQFLPITVENGAIVEPKDTLISRNYGNDERPYMLVLDTRTDELNAENIKNQGLYISRKFIYAIARDKTEIRSLSSFANMTIDQEMLVQGAEWLEQKSSGYIFGFLFISLLLYLSIVILLYAAVVHLLLNTMQKVEFKRTLRVTTLAYLGLFIICTFTVSIGFIVTFILLFGANYLTAKYIPQNVPEKA